MTTPLSTSIPSEMISAPSEMRCIGTSPIHMKSSVAAIVRRTVAPMINPERAPMNTSSVTNTITSAAMTFDAKL